MKALILPVAAIAVASVATSARADIVHLDDVIIDGSLCTGADCVNGEAFGFDTIRLKENNLRIKFQDTSNSGSFPSNDWQLTANDSANGGANKFSIDDIDSGRTPFTIEAGAPSHSLYVDDGGRVGLGTSTPVVQLHVVDGNTPTLRLEQDGSSGFTPQTWDLAGNEANFFVRDVTNGSQLPFRIEPGADTNSIYIENDNDVGIGTNNPSEKLHVNGGNLKVQQTAAGTNSYLSLAAGSFEWQFIQNANTGRLTFFAPGGGAATGAFKFDRQAQENLLRIGVDAADEVEITGKLVVNNTQLNVPDFVFEDGYQLKSIDEQAAFMWQNKHLPALPKAGEGNKAVDIDVLSHQMGMLEELEKAHIYIGQLNQRLGAKEAELSRVLERVSVLEARLAQ